MHYPESVLENKTQKIGGDIEKPMDHLISARQSDLEIVNVRIKGKLEQPRERSSALLYTSV